MARAQVGCLAPLVLVVVNGKPHFGTEVRNCVEVRSLVKAALGLIFGSPLGFGFAHFCIELWRPDNTVVYKRVNCLHLTSFNVRHGLPCFG